MRHFLDMIADSIRENWEKPALTDYSLPSEGYGNEYTYGELYGKIQWLCHAFKQSGIEKGAHVAICGGNSANWAVAYLAVAAYRGVVVSIHNTQTVADIVSQIDFSDAAALFVERAILDKLNVEQLKGIRLIMTLDDFTLTGNGTDSSDGLVVSAENVCFDSGPFDELAQICFTSGSTARPKGVMLSNGNISNNVWRVMENVPYDSNRNFLSMLPPSHMYGLMTEVLWQLAAAKHIYFIGPLVSKSVLIDAIKAVRPYTMATIPAILNLLLSACGIIGLKELLKSCKQINVGGAAFASDSDRSLLDGDLPLMVGYGVSEAGPLISADLYANYRPGSCGRAFPGMEIRIVNGEIVVRGTNVMLGYYKDEEATRRKIDSDGWLHTGDAGYLDADGYLYVTGRLEQDMIVLPSGKKIIPQEIEALVNGIDGVVESLVVSRGGRLVALVYANIQLDINDVLLAVNRQLPLYSHLADVEFVYEPFQKTDKQTIKRFLY